MPGHKVFGLAPPGRLATEQDAPASTIPSVAWEQAADFGGRTWVARVCCAPSPSTYKNKTTASKITMVYSRGFKADSTLSVYSNPMTFIRSMPCRS